MSVTPETMSLFLDRVQRIAERLLEAEAREPVAAFLPPDDMARLIEPEVGRAGEPLEAVLDRLERVALATPRTGSRRFFNQLFSGRIGAAAAGEMVAALLNVSLYTYKVAGPHALIESALTRHMAEHAGYEAGEGVFSPGGSLANFAAMVIALQEAAPEARDQGLDGRRYTMYTSAESHYSIRKAGGMLGIGRQNVRAVPVDERGRMDAASLDAMVEEDRKAGAVPVAVVATSGTTVLAAFDPIEAIADVAEKHGLWLHVDAAVGGAMLLSEKHRGLLAGTARSHSMTWDAHKLMTVPLSCSVILCRDRGMLDKHFSEAASYLFQTDEDEYNLGNRSIQCGRRNDALKLWAAWKHLGDEGFGSRVDRMIELANYAADEIDRRPGLKLTCRPESINVCFEVEGARSEDVCERLRREQDAMVGWAEVRGRKVIRMACVNSDMEEGDIDALLESAAGAARRHARAD